MFGQMGLVVAAMYVADSERVAGPGHESQRRYAEV